jgi:hypothetical protein
LIDLDDADHARGVVYCVAQHHVLKPEHWFDEALAYWDTYERVGGAWCFRRRRVRSWYREYRDESEQPVHRVVATAEPAGPKRGGRMPEEFPNFASFWEGAFSDPVPGCEPD